MNQSNKRWIIIVLALLVIMTLSACGKKVQPAPPPPPPPPPPPAPTATLSANPTTIQKGQSTTLTWETANATDVTIEGIGSVQPTGTQQVTPEDSITYKLTAKGQGGTIDATARVTVTPPPPPPPPPPPAPTDEEIFNQNIKHIYFDYDKYDIRADQQAALTANAEFLKAHPNMNFTVEGHCDERGSTEYNLALGDKRANAVKQALVGDGVTADRIKTISYGKEKPFCTESNEQCWQQNRQGHFMLNK